LGSVGSRPAPRELIAALKDRSVEVRESAAWALAAIEDQDTAQPLEDAFMRETNRDVRLQELRALTFLDALDPSVVNAALSSKDPELRTRAVRMLAGASMGGWPEPRPRPRPRPMP
jgi:HEAT repeat protein